MSYSFPCYNWTPAGDGKYYSAVQSGADPLLGSVTLSGTEQEDSVITAGNTLSKAFATLGTINHQWYQDGVGLIVGATSAAYTAVLGDVGERLYDHVSGTDSMGNTWFFDSPLTGVIASNADVTAPTLSSPTSRSEGTTSGSGTISTNEGNGTLYWIVDQSVTKPSVAQIQAGNDQGGAAADDSGNMAISSTGTKNISTTGLTIGVTYYIHYQHKDAAGNDSAVVTSASFIPAVVTWQLAAGHYEESIPWTSTVYASQVAADTEPYVISPRPDSETQSYARQKWAHGSMDYEVPIILRGGAFPYHLEVDETNTDAALTSTITVGANFDSTGAYIVNIPAATIAGLGSGAKNIYIKATDQAGKEIKIWWSVTKEVAELDHFFFVDESYVGATKDGKFATPFADIQQLDWLSGSAGAPSAQKVLVLKEGNSVATPMIKAGGWNWNSTKYPCGIIGIPGEEPVVDCNGGILFGWANGTNDDFFLGGFKAINGLTSGATDSKNGFVSSPNILWDRWTMFDMTFELNASLETNSINPAMFPANNATTPRKHIGISNIRVSNLIGTDGGVNSGAVFDLNGWQYACIDQLTVSDWGTTSNANQLIMSKRNIADITLRRIEAIDNVNITEHIIDIRADNTDTGQLHLNNIEVTRCNLDSAGSEGIQYIRTTVANMIAPDGPFHATFNTIQGATAAIDFDNSCATAINVIKNATDSTIATTVEGKTSYTAGTIPVPTLTSNSESLSGTDFNADGTLTSAALTALSKTRGEIGHEIA